MAGRVLVERDGPAGIITVNRPEALNALNAETLRELKEAIAELSRDDAVRGIILTGAGEKAFVAGADISEMQGMTPLEAARFSELGQSVCRALELSPKPVIAAINGYALGGGCEIALACDVRLASSNAKIGQPEVGLGIPPGFGGTQRLARLLGRAVASELIFTGKSLDAERALAIGLVNGVFPLENLLDEAKSCVGEIAKNAPVAVALSKEAIMASQEGVLDEGLRREAELFALSFSTEDQKEGMKAFLEKRKAAFKGR